MLRVLSGCRSFDMLGSDLSFALLYALCLLLAVNCILQWSLCKEWCPQCKHPFDYLLVHKQLDGSVTDFLTEESVVLLKRAHWFEEYMRVRRHTRLDSVWLG